MLKAFLTSVKSAKVGAPLNETSGKSDEGSAAPRPAGSEHAASPARATTTRDVHINTILEQFSDQHDTTLIEACKLDRSEIIPDILDFASDATALVNAPGGQGESPLMVATQLGLGATVRCLVKLGADVNLRNTLGKTPLLSACDLKKAAIAQQLIALKADVEATTGEEHSNISALCFAAMRRCKPIVSLLLRAGARVDEPRDSRGFSPLIYASTVGAVDVMRTLLQAKADPLLTSNEAQNSLAYALFASKVTAVNHLLTIPAVVDTLPYSNSLHICANRFFDVLGEMSCPLDLDGQAQISQESGRKLDRIVEIARSLAQAGCSPQASIQGQTVWQLIRTCSEPLATKSSKLHAKTCETANQPKKESPLLVHVRRFRNAISGGTEERKAKTAKRRSKNSRRKKAVAAVESSTPPVAALTRNIGPTAAVDERLIKSPQPIDSRVSPKPSKTMAKDRSQAPAELSSNPHALPPTAAGVHAKPKGNQSDGQPKGKKNRRRRRKKAREQQNLSISNSLVASTKVTGTRTPSLTNTETASNTANFEPNTVRATPPSNSPCVNSLAQQVECFGREVFAFGAMSGMTGPAVGPMASMFGATSSVPATHVNPATAPPTAGFPTADHDAPEIRSSTSRSHVTQPSNGKSSATPKQKRNAKKTKTAKPETKSAKSVTTHAAALNDLINDFQTRLDLLRAAAAEEELE